ncbi:MAG: hypothetical protein V7767_04635 [Leeuwenhoekiella sp.]
MKRSCVFLLLSIFIFNLGGNFIVFKIQQYQVRREIIQRIRQGIPTEQLSLITIKHNQTKTVIWKESDEFSYDGIMYDVVKQELQADKSIVYYCVKDDMETALVIKLYKDLKKSQKTKNNRLYPVKIAFKILPSQAEKLPQENNFKIKDEISSYYNVAYSTLKPEIKSPPPKIV